MEKDFWINKWKSGQTGFHYDVSNPLLKRHIERYVKKIGIQVFLPLCGKTGDMKWFLDNNFIVRGVELHEPAVREFFELHKIKFEVKKSEKGIIYFGDNIEIFVGDLFEMPLDFVSDTNIIYDRASLVALPMDMRKKYLTLINGLLNKGKDYLLITFEMDKGLNEGPPFVVPDGEVLELIDKNLKRHDPVELKGITRKVFTTF